MRNKWYIWNIRTNFAYGRLDNFYHWYSRNKWYIRNFWKIYLHYLQYVSGLPKYLNKIGYYLINNQDDWQERSRKSQFPRYELTKIGFKWRSIAKLSQNKLKFQLLAEMVIFSFNPTTHPPGQVWRRQQKLRKRKLFVFMSRP